jgi:glycosyltransferase A (GT-A) superfamily protein (DUF2064 family)
VKTRLAATVGDAAAARLAHAALLDTLDVCEVVFGPARCHLALAGDLGGVAPEEAELRERLRAWTVRPQRGDGFGERLEQAHVDVHAAAGAPVVQIGMDTPHLRAPDLAAVARAATSEGAVLGRAEDGGWWVLASGRAAHVAGLGHVPMSSAQTGQLTEDLLRAAGLTVTDAPSMRDVDDAGDAAAAARLAPSTRFAREWHALGSRARTNGDEGVRAR